MIGGNGWLTPKHAAAFTDTSYDTIKRAIDNGSLEAVGSGHRRRISIEALNEWLTRWAQENDYDNGDVA